MIRAFNNRYEGIKGSPYYHDDWLKGTLELENGKVVKDVEMKLNLYENELIVKDGKQSGIINRALVKGFSLGFADQIDAHFARYPTYDKSGSDLYYKILHEGKMTLLENIKIIYEKASFEGAYSVNKTYDEFKQYPSYFFITADSDKPQKIKSTNKAFLKIFPAHQAELKRYISENLLDVRNAEDIMNVLRYYDQL